jgi:ankyrin repeat protein
MRYFVLLCVSAASLLAGTLLDAAKAGDKTAIRALIQQKADVKAAFPDGATALHWAAYHDDAESVDLLLKAGAAANSANDLGATPLWLAAQNGGAAVVARLLAGGANPNQALLSGETPLMVAARGGYVEVATQLLAKGANPNAHGTRGQTALMWAVSQQHPSVVKVLMAIPPHGYLGYNKNVPHGGETALMFAARVGDLESAKLLVAAGANVNDADAWGVTALTLAEHSGFTDLGLYLLDKGADPNKYDCGFAAIHEAIMRRDEKMVAALLEHGAKPDLPLKTWTPTRRSSDDWNFDPAAVGSTPLWMATRFGEPGIMRLLIAKGADTKFVHSIEYVAEAGFGQDTRKERTTLIMAAAGMGRAGNLWEPYPAREREAAVLDAVKIAVDLGGDINAVGLDGRSALDGANQLRMPTVVAYLTSKGAKATAPAGAGRGGRGGPAK